ncbi:MAG: hypothetical protein V7731_07500, partial [Amphritea sp.]
RTFLAPEYYGRGMAVLTAISMIGVAVVQGGSGWLLEWAGSAQMSPAEQYQMLFISLAGILAVAILIYCFSRKHGCSDEPFSASIQYTARSIENV